MRGLHFVIHPIENYSFAPETGRGGVRIAFNVNNITGLAEGLEGTDADWVFKPVCSATARSAGAP